MMAKTPDDLRSLARTHSEAALLTLVAVMNHEEATPAARISAANSILERAWGKPTPPKMMNDPSANSPLPSYSPASQSTIANWKTV